MIPIFPFIRVCVCSLTLPIPIMTEQAKKEKKKPENLVIPPKKPKLSKAERRALQEAQRAAKAGPPPPTPTPLKLPQKQESMKLESKETTSSTTTTRQQTLKNIQDDMAFSLFSHLPPYHHEPMRNISAAANYAHLHPAVLQLGQMYSQGIIRGGNARCRAMLGVFHQLVSDYNPPLEDSSTRDLRHHLDQTVLKPSFTYWTEHCRPHSVSMGNAFTFLKSAVASLDRDIELEALKKILGQTIQAYIQERMDFAHVAICEHASSKIVDGDVLLVYGHSEVIVQLLVMQKEQLKKTFRVIVVDGRPLLEGRRMLESLKKANVMCSYILLNCISYVMKDVTKVLLGAAALMSDGSVLGRVGTACVALSSQRKAVLVCCETYKISNRVQLESITGNELGDPKCVYAGEKEENLRMLNLLYDLTPSNYISGIVTEMGILPPTSVAVLLREMNPHETMTDTSVL